MGVIKRVGDGSSISIWNDKWIPSTATFMLMGKLGNDPLEKVPDLIDPYSGCRNMNLIRNNFLFLEADAILDIPLERRTLWLGLWKHRESTL